MAVAGEVRGDLEQVVPAVGFALEGHAGTQETEVALLEEVVGRVRVAGHSRQVAPQDASRPVVEGPERLLVHLQDGFAFPGPRGQAVNRGQCHVASRHGSSSFG